jgi:Zn ribbon nucleic-acid-binding protein
MARIFKPKPGHRCIVCWKFYPDNPADITIPLAISSGIAGGTTYALVSQALKDNPLTDEEIRERIRASGCEMCHGPVEIDIDREEGVIQIECYQCGHEYWKEFRTNPQIKITPKEHMERIYKSITQHYPSLDKHDFQYAYNIAIASMPDRKKKKLRYIMGGMSKEEKEDIRLQEFKTDSVSGYKRFQDMPSGRIYFDEGRAYAYADNKQILVEFFKNIKFVPYKIDKFVHIEGEPSIIKFINTKDKNVITSMDSDRIKEIGQNYFLTGDPEYQGHQEENDFPILIMHSVRKYGFALAPKLDYEENPPLAQERYETFHGVPVDKTFKAHIPDPIGKLTPVSKIDHIVYECAGKKSVGDEGEDISYIHKWKKNKMILARDEDNNYFICGKCRVLKSGINDYKGKPTWSMNKPKVKIPKKVR